MADYLLGEVLERQEPEVLEFLHATSVCEQLTADLARRLSGREDAGALLDELERTNSFITSLGHGWYRYHPMFRQYLRADLSRRQHHRTLELHRVAAEWFETQGDTLGAVEHAAEAEDDALLSALLVMHGLRHVTVGESTGSGASCGVPPSPGGRPPWPRWRRWPPSTPATPARRATSWRRGGRS